MQTAAGNPVPGRPPVAIVAADPELRERLLRLLRALGLDPGAYGSAEEYLADQPSSKCVITEVDLPGMSGVEFLRALRAHGRTVPVVVVADEADVPLAVEAMRAGASDFIEKPHVDAALVRRVLQLIAHAR
jgi:two-component system, LuxR family, response regulator FixJ